MTAAQPNERLLEIYNAFVAAGRQVVEDLNITEDELHKGSAFLQRLGQEGFLVGLVDTVFATAASQAAAKARGIEAANLEGPLYLAGAPVRSDGNIMESPPAPGALPLTVTGRVYDIETGEPIAGAELDFWQADEKGIYDLDGYHLRGIILSGDDGTYALHTIVPEAYTLHADDLIADLYAMMGRHAYRSAHIHLKVRVDGQEVLTTQFYDSGSRFLDTDYVVEAVRDDLIIERAADPDDPDRYRMTFDIPVRRQ